MRILEKASFVMFLVMLYIFIVTVLTVRAATLTWDANKEADLAGYRIYSRVGANPYGAPLATLGKVTTYTTVDAAPGIAQFFAVTAYDTSDNESPKSAEVSKVVPLPGPTADQRLDAIKREVCTLTTASTLKTALRKALGGCP